MQFSGAVCLSSSYDGVEELKVAYCSFTENEATSASTIFGGGAIGVSDGNAETRNIIIENSQFQNNTAAGNGGAVFINATDEVRVENCTFNNNSAVNNGGAIYIACGSENTEVNFTGCTFDSNSAQKLGGAVSLESGGLKTRIDNALFESNTTGGQGGNAIILIQSTTATHSSINSTNGAAFYSNGAEDDGIDRDTLLVYKMGSNYNKNCVVEIADYMLDGTRLNWKLLGTDSADNYVLYDAERNEYSHLTGDAWNQHTELYLGNETGAPSESNVYSNVFINNYAGQFGGAICNRGSLTIGEPGEDIAVNKIWDDEQEQEHDGVTVNLVRKSDNAKLDSLTLGAESEWSGTFYGFPKNVEYAVTEEPVEGYTAQITQIGNDVTVKNSPSTPINVKLMDITIYTGGAGYAGAVDADGEPIDVESGLPEPGFIIAAPESVDVSELTLVYQNGETHYEWTLEPYSPGEHNVYRFQPADGTPLMHILMQFTDKDGNVVVTDNFDIEDYLNQTLSMKAYGEGIDEGKVSFTDGENTYPITVGEAKVTVRSTTDNAVYADVEIEETVEGEPRIVVPEDTVYHINGGAVQVADDSGVALLFDDIIETDGSDSHKMLLRDRALKELEEGEWNFEYKYLDLVDTNNGNAWVKASNTVTVYWPRPEDAPEDAEFALLHFVGLHREMGINAVEDMVASCTVTNITLTPSEDDEYLCFEIGPGGFSPFVLAWSSPEPDEPDEPDIPPYIPPVRPVEPEYKPDGLNTKDHFAYIIGYEDGTVRPNGSITRAEVATIFFRLLTDETREQYWSSTNSYTDVKSGDWFNNAVSTLSNMGILGGYADGTFRPDATITRAEFAKIAVSFFKYKDIAAENIFTDVVRGSWYESFVTAAAEIGLIEGYEDGTFRPDASITRAEACTIINRTLGRAPEKEHLLPESEMQTWPDNPKDAWYYAQIQEATNSHEYKWLAAIEQWTAKLPDRDWSLLEK